MSREKMASHMPVYMRKLIKKRTLKKMASRAAKSARRTARRSVSKPVAMDIDEAPKRTLRRTRKVMSMKATPMNLDDLRRSSRASKPVVKYDPSHVPSGRKRTVRRKPTIVDNITNIFAKFGL